jgi:sodium/hydrogen antiporter
LIVLLLFAVTLLAAVLLSGLAHRSVLSTAVIFLIVGFLAGQPTGTIDLNPGDESVRFLIELAVFTVLFTDGMRVSLGEMRRAWRLPGRALLFGLPLTLLGIGVLGHFVAGLPWWQALLLGAALSPTDPVFAAAIVGREEVPRRIRHLLNVESGLNDGLALPFVVVLLHVVQQRDTGIATVLGELSLGILLGAAIAAAGSLLERIPAFSLVRPYDSLCAFAVGMIIFAATSLTHANGFLAAYSGGLVLATLAPHLQEAFEDLGELLSELLKLAALMVFGSLVSPHFLADVPLSGYLFAILVLLIIRPIALSVSLFGHDLDRREWLAAAWFGPRGFASVVFGLLILSSGVDSGERIFHLLAIVVSGSILAHSSTDVLVARTFHKDG